MENKSIHYEPDFVTPFGTILGTFQGVHGYSNGSDHYYSRETYFHNGIYTGANFQCVEYARRWLQVSKGLNFHNFPYASLIWNLKYVERLTDGKATSITPVPNGSNIPPIPDSILIWKSTTESFVGHIAIITEVSVEKNFIRIAEQNLLNDYWPGNYSRQLKLDYKDGRYWIRDEDEIHGWMVIDYDIDNQAEKNLSLQRNFQRLINYEFNDQFLFDEFNKPYLKLYADLNRNYFLNMREKGQAYYLFESHFYDKIKYATMEMNWISAWAIDKVIKSEDLLKKLGIPQSIWQKLRKSWSSPWESMRNSILTVIEFGTKKKDVKVLKLIDPIENILESTDILEKIAKNTGCDVGKSTSHEFEDKLVCQFKKIFNGHVHIMTEQINSSSYYLKEIIEKAGLTTTIVIGLEFLKNELGKFIDIDGIEIKNVFKLWDWNRVIEEFESPRNGVNLKISDILLNDDIVVLEPIWKIITQNIGIFQIMTNNLKAHPYLLKTEFELDDDLIKKGYVKKSLIGEKKIDINDKLGQKLKQNEEQLKNDGFIYQEYFEVDTFQGFTPKILSFNIGGEIAGFFIKEKNNEGNSIEKSIIPSRVVFNY